MFFAQRRRWLAASIFALSSAVGFVACSASDSGSNFDRRGGGGNGGEPGTGNGGNGGSLIGDNDAGDSDGSSDDFGDACATATQKAALIPLDIYVMMDQSGSMDGNIGGGLTRWDAVVDAIETYVTTATDPDSLSIGLQYFGLKGDTCDPAPYAVPEVPVAPLTMAQQQKIKSSLAKHSPSTGTPTRPAMAGAVNFAKGWQVNNPTHKTIVVFATDGEPGGCEANPFGPSIDEINSIAQTIVAPAFTGNPPIQTFVIGVGDVQNLNLLAFAGGTQQAFIVDQGPQQFVDAMEKIRGAAVGCQYQIPPAPSGGSLDYDLVNVQFTPGTKPGGTLGKEVFAQVSGQGDCGAAGGWYYDKQPPAEMPTQIVLCPSTCNAVSSDTSGGEVQVLFGCGTKRN